MFFILVSVLQVVVTGGILSMVMWFNSRDQLVHEIERRLTTLAVLRTEQLQDYLSGEVDKMELIATRIQIVNYLSSQANVNESIAVADLNSAVSAVSEFMSAAIYNYTGVLLFATNTSQFNESLSASALENVQSNVHFDLPVYVQGGWKYLLSRNITVVGSVFFTFLFVFSNVDTFFCYYSFPILIFFRCMYLEKYFLFLSIRCCLV